MDISSGRSAPDEVDADAEKDVISYPEEPEQPPEVFDDEGTMAVTNTTAVSKLLENNDAESEERTRREALFDAWKLYFASIVDLDRILYEPPSPSPIPRPTKTRSAFRQVFIQAERNSLLARRNAASRVLDMCLVLLATCIVSYFSGVTVLTSDDLDPGIDYEILASGNPIQLMSAFPSLFRYAYLQPTQGLLNYAMWCGVVIAVILGLVGTKNVTSTRTQFLREAGSGISANAYFMALNLTSLLEHSIQILLAGALAYWIRSPANASAGAFLGIFFMLQWVTIAWSLLLALLLPAASVVIGVVVFMAVFGFLFSGEYKALLNICPFPWVFWRLVFITNR